jgi:hypothetical protein
MKSVSTGAGLAFLGLGIAVHPLLAGLVPSATASAPAVAAITAAASAQAEPTVVWMGVTTNTDQQWIYHRLWSDGRIEQRAIWRVWSCNYQNNTWEQSSFCASNWVEVPPPPGGNGFACRTDINGDRKVDAADLSSVLNAWGQQGGCEPDATYPCLDLGNLAGGVAMK